MFGSLYRAMARSHNSIKNKLMTCPKGSLIRVRRDDLEGGWIDGYLAGMGPDFFGLNQVDNGIHLNGFCCIRYMDVSSVECPAPTAPFMHRVVQLRGEEPTWEIPADLSSLAALIRTAGAVFPVVCLHLESSEPHVCYPGRILSVNSTVVRMRYISPGGIWGDDEDHYYLSEITRVDFGGSYEEALALHGNEGTNA